MNISINSLLGKVSLDRIAQFVTGTELLDHFSDNHNPLQGNDIAHRGAIGFNNAVFTWSKEDEKATQQSPSRLFRLRVEGGLSFKRGRINLIVGPT